jgi:hypothetical protein
MLDVAARRPHRGAADGAEACSASTLVRFHHRSSPAQDRSVEHARGERRRFPAPRGACGGPSPPWLVRSA